MADPLDGFRRGVYWLDRAFPVPFTRFRFGLDALIGLIPGLGDAAGGLLSCWGLLAAIRLRVPVPVFLRMIGNILLDVLIGEVPILGDLLDVAWQANQRNLVLLESWRADPAAVRSDSATGLRVLGALAVLALLVAGALTVFIAWSIVSELVRLF